MKSNLTPACKLAPSERLIEARPLLEAACRDLLAWGIRSSELALILEAIAREIEICARRNRRPFLPERCSRIK